MAKATKTAYEKLMEQVKPDAYLDGKPEATYNATAKEESKTVEQPVQEVVVKEVVASKPVQPNKVKPVVEQAVVAAQPLIRTDVPTYVSTGNVMVHNANTGLITSMSASAAHRLCRQSPKTYKIV